ncbi:MAG: MBL fold metallo-hydrolase [Candidatus Kerfeldbacteria bacterium]|nr:MBL fold metallo-hydrolase [Candidatus Kerfeldbacteria bacterium]
MRRRLVIITVAIAASLILVGWVGLTFLPSPSLLRLTFFDVGQGDAALIQTPDGQIILIDGGPDRTILKKLGSALPWNERTIDLMILSHPHSDHVSGLIPVLERYRVRQVLASGVVHTTPEYLKWLELVRDKKIPLTVAQAGQRLELAGGVAVEVLWPVASYAGQRVGDLNATSIVNQVRYGATSVLFTGDTPRENEQVMLEAGADLKADILKVAHQGSRTSSSEEFISSVAPEVAVIPVGRHNRYGHPHAEVVERLSKLVHQVLRTDLEGDIKFVSDGYTWQRR